MLKGSRRLNARNSLRRREPLSLPRLETGSVINSRHMLPIGNAETRPSTVNGNYSKSLEQPMYHHSYQTASNESVSLHCNPLQVSCRWWYKGICQGCELRKTSVNRQSPVRKKYGVLSYGYVSVMRGRRADADRE